MWLICGGVLRVGWRDAPRHLRVRRYSCLPLWPAHKVRTTFLEFFEALDHQRVCSSPVIPWNDSSLTYVNAGMNQFKPVFLGMAESPYPRATSSQKCIRVGGKHNDLADVGTDTYHHTFFEMLGSWSFGDYFKEEACSMAWKLLTEVYGLPASSLYVTYFKGDEALELESDLEAKHIWQTIGVPEERILPFGMQDNFWEMGVFGPCGPCTEIHYDRLARPYAGDRVNMGVEDVIELWNIVFIQYERQQDGKLRSLDTHFVDTGMGLERLTAVLNNKSSNYDTDLFTPIISAVKKMSGRAAYSGGFSADKLCLDTAYRVLADHTRMMAVCLADGMYPHECYNLSHIMKRSFAIGMNHFGFRNGERNMSQLVRVVAEVLGNTYPEVVTQLPRITTILEHEEHTFYETQEDVSRGWEQLVLKRPELRSITSYQVPRVVEGTQYFLSQLQEWYKQGNIMPGAAAHNLHATYGFTSALVTELAQVYGLVLDEEGFEAAMDEARERARKGQRKAYYGVEGNKEAILLDLCSSGLPYSDDTAKYLYKCDAKGQYEFPPVTTNILALISKGRRASKVESNECGKVDDVEEESEGRDVGTPGGTEGMPTVGVILQATNFYHEAGGQEGDIGTLQTGGGVELKVNAVDNISGYLVHWCSLEHGKTVAEGEQVVARICEETRLSCMRHHTATHLLNSVIRALTGVSCQTSSKVTSKHLMLQLHTYQPITTTLLTQAQHRIQSWIAQRQPIQRRTMNFQELVCQEGVTLVPGEVYPYTVHVISTRGQDSDWQSLEPCCGTHLLNTAHINSFVIENVVQVGQTNTRIFGVCGTEAASAERNGAAAIHRLKELQGKLNEALDSNEKQRLLLLDKEVHEWQSSVLMQVLPYVVRCSITEAVKDLVTLLKNSIRLDSNVEMVNEVRDIMSKQPTGPIVHMVETDFGTSKPKLRQATKIAKERPILLLVRSNGIVMGRCTLPEEVAGRGASAQEWLGCVQRCLGGVVDTPPGRNPELVANLKTPRLTPLLQESLCEALDVSSKYIDNFSD